MPTPTSSAAPGPRLLRLWHALAPLPWGSTLFSLLLGRMVPYTATLGARVETLAPGHARVRLRDRRRVRNHLRSVHAVALVNLGELATGLAVLTSLEPGVRGIVTRLETHYFHKARGTLTAECRVEPVTVRAEEERVVRAPVVDAEGRVVAEVRATWRLRP